LKLTEPAEAERRRRFGVLQYAQLKPTASISARRSSEMMRRTFCGVEGRPEGEEVVVEVEAEVEVDVEEDDVEEDAAAEVWPTSARRRRRRVAIWNGGGIW
jgi:hypothetical protein